MSFEKMLYEEFGEEKVSIDYSAKDNESIIELKIISKDGKKEFRADGIRIIEDYLEIDGRKYTVKELIMALNVSFNKGKN